MASNNDESGSSRKKKGTRGVTLMRKIFKAKSSGIKLEVSTCCYIITTIFI
jgi:hypothetical protein